MALVSNGDISSSAQAMTPARTGIARIDGRRSSIGIARTYMRKSTRAPAFTLSRPFQRVHARAVGAERNLADDRTDGVLYSLVVLLEDFHHGAVGDGRHP